MMYSSIPTLIFALDSLKAITQLHNILIESDSYYPHMSSSDNGMMKSFRIKVNMCPYKLYRESVTLESLELCFLTTILKVHGTIK